MQVTHGKTEQEEVGIWRVGHESGKERLNSGVGVRKGYGGVLG